MEHRVWVGFQCPKLFERFGCNTAVPLGDYTTVEVHTFQENGPFLLCNDRDGRHEALTPHAGLMVSFGSVERKTLKRGVSKNSFKASGSLFGEFFVEVTRL